MGTRTPRTDPDTWHSRYWRRRDVDTLLRLIDEGRSYDYIAKRLGRTRTAVEVKAKKLRYRLLTTRAAMTCREAARLLGLRCAKTMALWIKEYGLPATNGGTKAKPIWRIQWLDLMQWLEEPTHWMAYDSAKVTEPPLREHLLEIRQGQPRWLSVGEVARRYCVHINTVKQWRIKGLLPMTRYGNWWVRESDLDGFVPPCERSKAGIPLGVRRVLSGKDRIVAGEPIKREAA